ncbi:hypothetical protein [Duganella sp.]|uniref:hypothetical protein n=1 Tax=Duganella sp. TaxID=1904440 RepID=UPI0031D2AA26
MRAATQQITVGSPVRFDSDHGFQTGKVADIKADLSNGRRIAAVQVPGALDGQPWHIPVDELQPATKAT